MLPSLYDDQSYIIFSLFAYMAINLRWRDVLMYCIWFIISPCKQIHIIHQIGRAHV